MIRRLKMIGSALSQLGCVILTWDVTTTNPNESISSRAYRLDTKLKSFINRVFFWQKDHCKSAYDYDLKLAYNLIKQHEDREDVQTKPA